MFVFFLRYMAILFFGFFLSRHVVSLATARTWNEGVSRIGFMVSGLALGGWGGCVLLVMLSCVPR